MTDLRLTAAARACLLVGFAGLLGCAADESAPPWYPSEVVSEPRLFAPGTVSGDTTREFGLTFTPDMRTTYFTRRVPGERQKIWVARYVDGAWGEAEIAPFSNDVDENPWITPDGRTLYFATRRPGVFETPDPSDNIWRMTREGDSWSDPRPLPGPVNRPRPEGSGWPVGSELNPRIGPDGALYYWTKADSEGASPDIYRAEPEGDGFGPGVPLGPPVNTPSTESHVAFGPGGMMVLQGYGRDDDVGAEDLFVSWPTEDGWSEPRALPPPVNTTANEGFPDFTPDGRFLFFASDRGGEEGAWSIWYVELSTLGLSPP